MLTKAPTKAGRLFNKLGGIFLVVATKEFLKFFI
jgi:hypothetical protein